MAKYRFGIFEFDDRAGELRRDGQLVRLQPQPSRVLSLLLARPGEVILREELRDHLWGGDTFVDFERGLNFCILQVRAALGDSSDNPRFVQTVPRKGYRFIAPVAADLGVPGRPPSLQGTSVLPGDLRPPLQPPSPQETSVLAADLGPPPPPPSSWWTTVLATSLVRSRWWTVGIAICVIFAPILWWMTLRGADVAGTEVAREDGGRLQGRRSPSPSPSPDSAPGATHPRLRVAVLPFLNLTRDASADDLADGLTDEVISQLGRLGQDRLSVIARTSVMSYRNASKTIAEIGRELNAGFVIESSIRRDGDMLRISSSLVPTAEQAPTALWSETFGGNDPSSMGSQTSAAIRIARLIALELLPEATAPTVSSRTGTLAAWESLMHGRALMNRGTSADVKQAIVWFEHALRSDPAMAITWAKLAEAHHLLVMMGAVAPSAAYPKAEDAAVRALATEATLPEAHVAKGLVELWYNRRPAAAAASFERALALNASSAVALHDYAWALVALGRDDEAVSRISAARDLDPLSARANNDIGWLYLHLRQPADAMRACEHTLAVQPDSLEAQACLERAYAQRGMFDAALRAARATLPPDATVPPLGNGSADAETMLKAVWRSRLDRLERAARTRWISPYTLAVTAAQVGDTARAIDHLEAAVDQQLGMLTFLNRDPAIDPLRKDPRFRSLIARLNETAR